MTLTARVRLGATSALGAFVNPTRDDLVAILGEVSGYPWPLKSIRDRMLLDSTGRRILRTRPNISTDTLALNRLRSLDPLTFGRKYVDFMDAHCISADTRKPIHHIDDEECAYVMKRYRQVHDFWHVLLDLPISIQGELAVKWFEWVQTGLPVAAVSALVGPFKLDERERRDLWELVPWAVQVADSAPFLMNVMYEDLLDTPIDQVRQSLGFFPRPPLPLDI